MSQLEIANLNKLERIVNLLDTYHVELLNEAKSGQVESLGRLGIRLCRDSSRLSIVDHKRECFVLGMDLITETIRLIDEESLRAYKKFRDSDKMTVELKCQCLSVLGDIYTDFVAPYSHNAREAGIDLDYTKAIFYFEASLSADPNASDSKYFLGLCYLHTFENEPLKAYEILRCFDFEKIKQDECRLGGTFMQANTYSMLGVSLEQKGLLTQAAQCFEIAYMLDNTDPTCQYNLAQALLLGKGVAKDEHRAEQLIKQLLANKNEATKEILEEDPDNILAKYK